MLIRLTAFAYRDRQYAANADLAKLVDGITTEEEWSLHWKNYVVEGNVREI